MSGIGGKFKTWDKELDKKLLSEISTGKKVTALTVSMKMSATTIRNRLKEMGFNNISDAKKVLII